MKWGGGGEHREKKKFILTPSQSHLNFQCLARVLDKDEHITSAALLRLHLGNKMVLVFVSSPYPFSSVRYYLGLSKLTNPVISHSANPLSPPVPTKSQRLP